ncbi:hypothetical protein E2P81_ATG09670 [Venturia nashicola]|nr:hypothetical protein E2P81_ATG09670 [Venturia nashicola]
MKFSPSAHEVEQNAKLAHAEVGITALFLTLTWTVVAMRFWVRSHILHTVGMDDWLVLLAQIFFTAYCAIQMVILHLVPGIAPATFALMKLVDGWFISGTVQYAFAMTALKLSLGACFLRVIASQWQRRVVYVVMIAATIANLIEAFYIIFMCGDPHHFTEKTLLGKCAPPLSMAFVAYGQNTVNTLTDIILALLPCPLLWKSNMKRAQKWTVGLILALATAGCISSAVRFVYIPRIIHPKPVVFYKTIKPLTIVCIVEIGTGILACSLATLRPLFSNLVDLSTIRYSVSRCVHIFRNTRAEPEFVIQRKISNEAVSSQNSKSYENQHDRNASKKDSFFQDADGETVVVSERREKSPVNSSLAQPRRCDELEGSEVNFV